MVAPLHEIILLLLLPDSTLQDAKDYDDERQHYQPPQPACPTGKGRQRLP